MNFTWYYLLRKRTGTDSLNAFIRTYFALYYWIFFSFCVRFFVMHRTTYFFSGIIIFFWLYFLFIYFLSVWLLMVPVTNDN